MELPTTYDHTKVEDKIYALWEKSGFFNPDRLPKREVLSPSGLRPSGSNDSSKDNKRRKPFTILMPPTNANGSLHAGHGLVLTIEDIMTRYKRMRGYKTLWLPGLDHAGFETQVVYEKQLEKEGRSRFQMEPQQLYREIMEFTLNNKKNIENQTRKIGASCDWSREKFTLDANVVETVYATFKKLSRDNLVYRGRRIINWCAKHQTSLSDLETIDREQEDTLYYLQYGPFTIATARPETKFGDKYVVVHPKDERYKQYREGQKIEVEWMNGKVEATVIKDEAIDMEFGTGAMTITPWHDPVDFDIAKRKKLDEEQIIDFRGKLLPIAGEFAGMNIREARPLIVEKLKTKGLLVKTEPYKHTVKVCYKCETLIEPQIREQWFVSMKELAKPAIKAIVKNEIVFIPKHYKKIILHWLKNIEDWNISRQIVWGIPIPGETDTFDTWFSSGQWPFAALGYPNSKDFKTFYPTDVMETAGEIIFFWVARMIMLGLYVTGKVPFKTVYLHGLVLDAKGKKMSKSKGNVINPLDLTTKYGTDAFRIGLIVGNTPGTSLALDENRIRGYRNFANKVWNASRFVLMNLEGFKAGKKPTLSPADKKILTALSKTAKEATKLMDEFKFYKASELVYHYFWHTFADKIIEAQKPRLGGKDAKAKAASQYLLLEILQTSLKLLHPFMPFITEEIYQKLHLKNKKKTIMIESWPSS